ncbi:hypothetical protein GGR34_003232 [Microvirga flocculans]|uniref:Carbohydrate-binding/sugar hydrolysis domain-containing protein n=1 Tax=Microvirga flocculans TaxID=217168 RepID=A0A7W6IHE7_9HYPH|nr:right-handed parallel beta-helix repeat-containing protein [Microvirga flocculans]MBB4041555.1 hypothetical protein [Microvirga flocculans]
MTFDRTRVSIILALAILHAEPVFAVTLFVSTTGDDTNPGTVSRPFRTISKAAQEAGPGTKIAVQGGLYKEVVDISTGGSAELPVMIEPASAEQVIIDGSGTPPDTNLVQISANYVHFSGFTVRNATRTGIAAWGTQHVRIANNKVYGSLKAGIWVGHSQPGHSSANIVEQNEVWNNCLENISRNSDGGWAQGISLLASNGSRVVGNRVYRNYGEGIGTLSTEGVSIVENSVYDNFSVNIYLDNAPSTIVQENKVFHTYDKRFYRYGKPAIGIMIANEYTDMEMPSRGINVTRNVLAGVGRVTYGDYQRASGLFDSVIDPNTVMDRPESLW